ncbi:hypothetical protein [Streptomyces sp. NPDC047028]|uniref:hypothetical protein n=1 Tax=Streptomyces sp. NPDC047028 TaxID=3155793 RepID=UPI00340C96A6
MITTATARSFGRIDEATAAQVADLWNAAYPTMRAILTGRIDSYRTQIRDEAWIVDPSRPNADVLQAYAPSEAKVRRGLKRMEELRRDLGQLDRGTYRACTRSPGGFDLTSAYWAVRYVLNASSNSTRDLASVYHLAAVLSRISDAQAREWASAQPQSA